MAIAEYLQRAGGPLLTVPSADGGSNQAIVTDGNGTLTFGNPTPAAHDHDASYQPLDAELTALASLSSAANTLPYFTGSGSAGLADLSSAGRALIDDADAAAQRATLGLTLAGGYSVKWTGATGDGSTDDKAAIQAAIDAVHALGGGIVSFPPGTYRLSGSLVIYDNVQLRGYGKASILKLLSGANSPLVINANTAAGNTGIVLSGLYLDGNKAQQTAAFSCIVLVRCTKCEVSDCWLTGALRTGTFPAISEWGEGVIFLGGSYNRILRNFVFSNSFDGIKGNSEQFLEIRGNHCWDNGRCGIQLYCATSAVGYSFTGSTGTKTDGSLYCLIANNICTHATGTEDASSPVTSGIYLHCASYCTVVGNLTSGMAQGFGSYDAAEDNFIVGNLFRVRGNSNASTSCLAFETATVQKNTVTGNTFVAIAGDAKPWLRIYGSANIIRSNRFLREGATGTWSLVFTSSSASNLFRGNDYDAASVSDSGTNNVVNLSDAPAGAASVLTLTDAATIAWDASNGKIAKVMLGGNRTLANPTSVVNGDVLRLLVTQDGTGSRTLSFGSNFAWSAGTAPTFTTIPGVSDLLIFRVYDGKLLGSSILNYVLSGGVNGTGSSAVVVSSAGAGAVAVSGAGSAPAALSGSGAGTVVGGVVGNAPVVLSGSGGAAVTVSGAANKPMALSGSAAGAVSSSGAGSAAIATSGSGAGTVSGGGSSAPNDTFTGSAGTALASHTPDDGGSWTKHTTSGLDNAQVLSNANRLSKEVSGESVYYHSWTPATADYDVLCDIVPLGGGVVTGNGVGGRISTSANTMYFAWWNHNAGGWQLWKAVAGSFTQLGSTSSATLTNGTAYRLKLEMRGTAIKLYVDGTQKVSVTDSSITAAGKSGIVTGFSGDDPMSNTAGYHLDNFAAADA